MVMASASADLDALGNAVATCDRPMVNAAFSAEMTRRSEFMRQTFREQEEIVDARRALAQRRREARSGLATTAESMDALDAEGVAIEDRQRALNDQRLLENLRQETMDSLRRLFLQNCSSARVKS